jgi:hypothetical protein
VKYAVVVIVAASLGVVFGLLAAWGAAAYPSPANRGGPDGAALWFMLPGCGGIGGLVVGVIAAGLGYGLGRPDRRNPPAGLGPVC